MLLKFSDFDLSNGVNSTDFVPTDRKPKFKYGLLLTLDRYVSGDFAVFKIQSKLFSIADLYKCITLESCSWHIVIMKAVNVVPIFPAFWVCCNY
jgi:hypothetical protein